MALTFRFAPNAGLENAALDVDLNGSSLGHFPAATTLRFKIPPNLLRQQNVLNLKWQGLASTAWLLPSSEFELPRDYQSALPDLNVLQHGLFPFSLRADLSDTVIVLPDGASDDVNAALFEFSGQLARLVPTQQFAFKVKHSSELTQSEYPDMIAFHIGDVPKGSVAMVQESISQKSAEKYVLHITANSPATLRAAIRTAFTENTLKQLKGDTATLFPDRVTTSRKTSARKVSQRSYFTHLQVWLRENWIALPVILTTVSCLMFVGLRLGLAQYKRANGPRNPL
jgi:hypothetical protein